VLKEAFVAHLEPFVVHAITHDKLWVEVDLSPLNFFETGKEEIGHPDFVEVGFCELENKLLFLGLGELWELLEFFFELFAGLRSLLHPKLAVL
jgi:hypothetical protein